MPIDGISSRLPEIGRIRIGVYDEGKGHPEKLETFRLTSSHMDAIQAAAKLYGGVIGESKVGYDLVTETDTLVVMLPAQGAFSQYMESWSAAGATRRCDGITELLTSEPCVCEAEGNRVCEPRSNLRVVMPQVPGIGVWRLATQGWTAAAELKGSVALIEEVAHRGQSPTVELVLEQRERKIPGETLRRFAVPVLRLPYTLAELGGPETRSLGSGAIVRVDTVTGEINPQSAPIRGRSTGADGGSGSISQSSDPPSSSEGTTSAVLGEGAAGPSGQSPGGEPAQDAGADPPGDAPKKKRVKKYPLDPKVCKHTVGIDLDLNCVDCGTKMAEASA